MNYHILAGFVHCDYIGEHVRSDVRKLDNILASEIWQWYLSLRLRHRFISKLKLLRLIQTNIYLEHTLRRLLPKELFVKIGERVVSKTANSA